MAGGYSDDDSYGDYGTTYSESNTRGYSDDESYGDRGTTYSGSNTREYSDDESYGDYRATYSDSKTKSGEDSEDEPYAVRNYGTTYSGSKGKSGGNQVSVHQQTFRAKNENKQSGSYERFTAKDKTVRGEPFVDRSGNRGYKDEHTKSTTYKVGDKRGYTEYSREEKVKHVDYGKSSYSNNKAVSNNSARSYSKYSKY